MTIEEFIAEFQKIAHNYCWTRWPELRGCAHPYNEFGNPLTPITAVVLVKTGKRFSQNYAVSAAFELGIDSYTASRIVSATDTLSSEHDLRAKLELLCFPPEGRYAVSQKASADNNNSGSVLGADKPPDPTPNP